MNCDCVLCLLVYLDTWGSTLHVRCMGWCSWVEDKICAHTARCRTEERWRLMSSRFEGKQCLWIETCSPDRCRCGRAGLGSQTSGRCYRYDDYRCSCRTPHNRSLMRWKTWCTETAQTPASKQSSDTHGRTCGLGGMQALNGGALCVCTHCLPIYTCAAGAAVLKVPAGAFFIFHPLQHTRYSEEEWSCHMDEMNHLSVCMCVWVIITFAYWTTEMWVYNRVGALGRMTLLFTANYSSTLRYKHHMQYNSKKEELKLK